MVQTPSRHRGSEFPAANSVQPAKRDAILLGDSAPLPNTKLFGTDGIRGKVGELLTASLASGLGKFYAKMPPTRARLFWGKTAGILAICWQWHCQPV
jgi:hypothetical protein